MSCHTLFERCKIVLIHSIEQINFNILFSGFVIVNFVFSYNVYIQFNVYYLGVIFDNQNVSGGMP